MRWIAPISLAAMLALTPGWVGAYRAVNRHEVIAISNDVFEVIGRSGSGASDYWCSAGYYARHKLATGATQRIYIWQAVGPSLNRPGKKSVQFSLTPPPDVGTSPGYSLSVKVKGDNLTSAAAMQYCYDRIEYSPDDSETQENLQNALINPAHAPQSGQARTTTG